MKVRLIQDSFTKMYTLEQWHPSEHWSEAGMWLPRSNHGFDPAYKSTFNNVNEAIDEFDWWVDRLRSRAIVLKEVDTDL